MLDSAEDTDLSEYVRILPVYDTMHVQGWIYKQCVAPGKYCCEPLEIFPR